MTAKTSNCAYCNKSLEGVQPVILEKKSHIPFFPPTKIEFCSQECLGNYEKREKMKELEKQAIELGEQAEGLASQLEALGERLTAQTSLDPSARDQDQIMEIKGELAAYSRPSLSNLKDIAKSYRELGFEDTAKQLESIATNYNYPTWTPDLPGLATSCDTCAGQLNSITGAIDDVKFPKTPNNANSTP